MEKERKIQLAAEMLKNARGYAKGECNEYASFDFVVNDNSIYVYNNAPELGAFYWGATCSDIANATRLTCFETCEERVRSEHRVIAFEKPHVVFTLKAW